MSWLSPVENGFLQIGNYPEEDFQKKTLNLKELFDSFSPLNRGSSNIYCAWVTVEISYLIYIWYEHAVCIWITYQPDHMWRWCCDLISTRCKSNLYSENTFKNKREGKKVKQKTNLKSWKVTWLHLILPTKTRLTETTGRSSNYQRCKKKLCCFHLPETHHVWSVSHTYIICSLISEQIVGRK